MQHFNLSSMLPFWLAVKFGLGLGLLLNLGLVLVGLSHSVLDSLFHTGLSLGGGNLMFVEVLHGGS